jgi:hypothetical protein
LAQKAGTLSLTLRTLDGVEDKPMEMVRLRDLLQQESPVEENAVLPIDIVVSKEKKPFSKSEAVKEAEKLLERPLDIWLPRDTSKARKAGELGQPMLEVARKTAISKPLGEVVLQLKELRATKSRSEAEGRMSDV